MRQVIVVGARTNELLAESALHRGLHWRLAIFRDADLNEAARAADAARACCPQDCPNQAIVGS